MKPLLNAENVTVGIRMVEIGRPSHLKTSFLERILLFDLVKSVQVDAHVLSWFVHVYLVHG